MGSSSEPGVDILTTGRSKANPSCRKTPRLHKAPRALMDGTEWHSAEQAGSGTVRPRSRMASVTPTSRDQGHTTREQAERSDQERKELKGKSGVGGLAGSVGADFQS